MSEYDYQKGQINQLKSEKYHLKLMFQRRSREIDAHIKNLEYWIDTEGMTLPLPKSAKIQLNQGEFNNA